MDTSTNNKEDSNISDAEDNNVDIAGSSHNSDHDERNVVDSSGN